MVDFFFKSWAEFFFFILMIVGFIVSLWATSFSAVISYIVVFLSGMVGGRLIYERKKNLPFPYYIIIIGFLICAGLFAFRRFIRITIVPEEFARKHLSSLPRKTGAKS